MGSYSMSRRGGCSLTLNVKASWLSRSHSLNASTLSSLAFKPGGEVIGREGGVGSRRGQEHVTSEFSVASVMFEVTPNVTLGKSAWIIPREVSASLQIMALSMKFQFDALH